MYFASILNFSLNSLIVIQQFNSKFVTKKWNIVNNDQNANYDVGNEIIYNTEVLKSNLCN